MDAASTEIYTLSLHDALPIYLENPSKMPTPDRIAEMKEPYVTSSVFVPTEFMTVIYKLARSEEHTSELQSRQYLVCRLLLEKKKTANKSTTYRSATLRNTDYS